MRVGGFVFFGVADDLRFLHFCGWILDGLLQLSLHLLLVLSCIPLPKRVLLLFLLVPGVVGLVGKDALAKSLCSGVVAVVVGEGGLGSGGGLVHGGGRPGVGCQRHLVGFSLLVHCLVMFLGVLLVGRVVVLVAGVDVGGGGADHLLDLADELLRAVLRVLQHCLQSLRRLLLSIPLLMSALGESGRLGGALGQLGLLQH